MKYTGHFLIASTLLAIPFLGCSDREAGLRPDRSGNFCAWAITDCWFGPWNGPEGTFLRMVGGQAKYEVTIKDWDSPRTFQGGAAGGQIQFERNGLNESIRTTSGAAMEMKRLTNKSNCLTVRAGDALLSGLSMRVKTTQRT